MLYSLISSSFAKDFDALPLILQVFKPRMTRGEARLLLRKLILIHETLEEVRKPERLALHKDGGGDRDHIQNM